MKESCSPFFSIVVPVYNAERFLDNCVETVLFQAFSDWELMLIDDGSNDGSSNICDKWASVDSRIMVSHISNGGVAHARKVGTKLSRGKYVLYLDADDYISLYTLQKLYSIITIKKPDIVKFHFMSVDDGVDPKAIIDKEYISNLECTMFDKKLLQEKIFPNLVQNEKCGYFSPSMCGKAFKRSLISEELMVDNREAVIGEDGATSASIISKASTLYEISNIMYFYRNNNESVTKSKKVYSWKCAEILGKHMILHVEVDDIEEQVYRYVTHMLFVVAASQFNSKLSYKQNCKIINDHLLGSYYQEAIHKSYFKLFSKGWFAKKALIHRMIFLIFIYNKFANRR